MILSLLWVSPQASKPLISLKFRGGKSEDVYSRGHIRIYYWLAENNSGYQYCRCLPLKSQLPRIKSSSNACHKLPSLSIQYIPLWYTSWCGQSILREPDVYIEQDMHLWKLTSLWIEDLQDIPLPAALWGQKQCAIPRDAVLRGCVHATGPQGWAARIFDSTIQSVHASLGRSGIRLSVYWRLQRDDKVFRCVACALQVLTWRHTSHLNPTLWWWEYKHGGYSIAWVQFQIDCRIMALDHLIRPKTIHSICMGWFSCFVRLSTFPIILLCAMVWVLCWDK